MPKYEVKATIKVTVEANNRKWARSAVKESLRGAWWSSAEIGFTQSRFKVTCTGIKLDGLQSQT